MSWCGGGEVSATPGCVCRRREISAVALWAGGRPASPGLRVPEAGYLGGHLVAGQLAPLAGLRALRDLDLELLGEGRVLVRHAEAPGRDLLDLRVPRGPEPCGVLAALARVRACAEVVER